MNILNWWRKKKNVEEPKPSEKVKQEKAELDRRIFQVNAQVRALERREQQQRGRSATA
jgi:hypothetical protein